MADMIWESTQSEINADGGLVSELSLAEPEMASSGKERKGNERGTDSWSLTFNQLAAVFILAIVGLNFLGSWFVSNPEGEGLAGGEALKLANSAGWVGSLRKDCFRNPHRLKPICQTSLDLSNPRANRWTLCTVERGQKNARGWNVAVEEISSSSVIFHFYFSRVWISYPLTKLLLDAFLAGATTAFPNTTCLFRSAYISNLGKFGAS
jgi:hypothetical protein